MPLVVWDTLRDRKMPLTPVVPGRVGMYVCGMTVQAPPHVGHMRAYVVADLIRRVLRARGYRVVHVQNFTDIDDKIIAKAGEAGRDWREWAEENIAAFFEAADWLGIERAEQYPRATEHIPEILAMIADLIAKGHAYASNGDVFFDVVSRPDYGKLSGKRIDELRTGVRIEVDEDKRHPVDFALWKAAKPGEPSWPSPWGPGRPGWHIECSAMSMKHIGHTLDLHGGGRDLVFPHHENELAQSESFTGVPFCNHWIQNGLVNLGGQKMSKSTGVLFAMKDVMREVDPAVLRLYLLSTHYRSPIEYAKERLDEAGTAFERIRNFLAAADHVAGTLRGSAEAAEGADADVLARVGDAVREFGEALDDDFNSGGAIGKIFEVVRLGNAYVTAGATSPLQGAVLARIATSVRDLASQLGVMLGGANGNGERTPAEVLDLVRLREEARRARNWAAADGYREQIRARGFVVEDRPDGPLVKAES